MSNEIIMLVLNYDAEGLSIFTNYIEFNKFLVLDYVSFKCIYTLHDVELDFLTSLSLIDFFRTSYIHQNGNW